MSDQKSSSVSRNNLKPQASKIEGRQPKKKEPRVDVPVIRPVSQGDISPGLSEAEIERFVIGEETAAAQESKITAVKDIVSSIPPHDITAITKALEAIMTGASADDAAVLRDALLGKSELNVLDKLQPDDELSEDWRTGGYPYKNLMTRKNYEKQKYRL